MAEILRNPINDIYERFKQAIAESDVLPVENVSFGKSDVGARMPWVAFKPMTNYTWLQARDLSNNECGVLLNLQIECFAKKESVAMNLEDETKAILFNMGFYSNGFNQRFKENQLHRYIARYTLQYTGDIPDLTDN